MSPKRFGFALCARAFLSFREAIAFARGQETEFTSDVVAYRSLVSFLFSSPGSLIPGVLVSILTPAICYHATGDRFFLVVTLVTILIGCLRYLTLFRYTSSDHSGDDLALTRRWDIEFTLGATTMGAVLGYNSFYALTQSTSVAAHLTVVSVNIALASGFVSRNAARPHFVLLQLTLFALPLAFGLLLASDQYYKYIGFLAVVFILNNVSIVFSVHRNLVALVQAKKTADRLSDQLHLQNLTLDAAINAMPHGLAMFDENLELAVANERHYALFSLQDSSAYKSFAATERHLVRASAITRADALSLFHACHKTLKERRATKVELVTRSGSTLIISFTPALEGGVLMLSEDATERRTSEAKIERLARFDTLTGLPNRHEFGQSLSRALEALVEGGPSFAIFYVDLDGFKRINDTLGHEIGDDLLVEVSKRLHRKRESEAIIARLGGDEFAAIHLVSGPETATAIAQEIAAALKEAFLLGNNTIRISASIGIALAPEHGSAPEAVLRHADIALYRAKAGGRGLTMVYDESMAAELNERLSLESDLAVAVAGSAFELHYQPIFDLATGKAVSYEALMRWPHPTRGFVPPSVFIPLAEQTGRIEQLGCFAIRQACADVAPWHEDVSVCVNVSVLQFRNPTLLIECVEAALASARLDPRRLILEITESLFIDEFDSTLATIERLKSLGVRFSLDDFGTGYSSLSNLSRLPLSIVKIDQSLAKDITFNTTSYAVVEAVCSLAKRIDMIVVVEGIETSAQMHAIQSIGADRGQGWLFGKPEPARRISERHRCAA
jgi:diguanylate cyclase (GGDEF)-like protein